LLNAGRAMSAPKRVTHEPLKERAVLSRKFLYEISTEEWGILKKVTFILPRVPDGNKKVTPSRSGA
jgi:hypothetical protein